MKGQSRGRGLLATEITGADTLGSMAALKDGLQGVVDAKDIVKS
jgi:hypothetical protein